jgi:glycosyltransferase involved in cell wall biosynthesis
MACGCPVVASGIPAIKEVGGEAPLYVDPRDGSSIASGLRRVAEDAHLRQTMVQRGRQRAKEFSWKRAASEVIPVITRTIGNQGSS